MSRFPIIVALAIAAVLLVGIGFYSITPPKPSVLRTSLRDPKLAAAVSEAKSHLVDFKKALAKPKTGQKFAVFAEFSTAEGPEYLWLKGITPTGKGVLGTIDQPPMVLPLKKGDSVKVIWAAVMDWMIKNPDGSIQGAYTQSVVH